MVSIRLGAPEDFEFFYQLKCEPSNIFWTGFDTPPERTSFQKWYERIIQNQGEKTNRKIYIIMDDNTPVGHIYIEPSGSDVFDIPMAISEKYWGHGYGKAAARLALEEARSLGFHHFVGKIREDNIASLRAYASLGVSFPGDYEMCYIPKLDKEVKMLHLYMEL